MHKVVDALERDLKAGKDIRARFAENASFMTAYQRERISKQLNSTKDDFCLDVEVKAREKAKPEKFALQVDLQLGFYEGMKRLESAGQALKSLTVISLSDIDLTDFKLMSLTLNDCKNVRLRGEIKGPVMLTRCSDVDLDVQAEQVRLSHCYQIKITGCTQTPITCDHCSDIETSLPTQSFQK